MNVQTLLPFIGGRKHKMKAPHVFTWAGGLGEEKRQEMFGVAFFCFFFFFVVVVCSFFVGKVEWRQMRLSE